MTTPRSRFRLLAVFVLALAVAAGCAKSSDTASDTSHGAVSTEALVKLAAADQVDGTTDKIVTKCAGCALHMDGMKEHALAVGDYEMHFCSAECKAGFADKTEDAILSMSVPEEAH